MFYLKNVIYVFNTFLLKAETQMIDKWYDIGLILVYNV